ncbi:MAG: type III PLP-dependent enzyme [Chitinivibrionales bacterium]|nr:type III PLP-dependent enzyme [Chitinivibrionales bacterium]MBD3395190.1 type III PLP-dependent enzyme [Chitinivibrionales bacterium]
MRRSRSFADTAMNFTTARKLVEMHGTPALFVSANRIRRSYRDLAAALPGVELFYAVKANAASELVRILADEGSSFDISTNGEIDIVRSCGIEPSRCLHTHPVKSDAEIRYALDFGIAHFVVDNEDELRKFLPYRDRARLLVRMSIQNPSALVNLSHKFGVAPQDVFALIEMGRELGLKIAGISFHAGSQNENALKFIEALEYCRDICWRAAAGSEPLSIIDIGGGFPINYITSVLPPAQFCQPVNEYLERYFANYRVIAEPGRYLCGSAATLATRVKGRALRDGGWGYYLDAGLYGSFSGKVYDHAEYPMSVAARGKRQRSVLAGPTCDSFDVLYENIALPVLKVGELLLFDSMGAYTNASASRFNGFEKAKLVVID